MPKDETKGPDPRSSQEESKPQKQSSSQEESKPQQDLQSSSQEESKPKKMQQGWPTSHGEEASLCALVAKIVKNKSWQRRWRASLIQWMEGGFLIWDSYLRFTPVLGSLRKSRIVMTHGSGKLMHMQSGRSNSICICNAPVLVAINQLKWCSCFFDFTWGTSSLKGWVISPCAAGFCDIWILYGSKMITFWVYRLWIEISI